MLRYREIICLLIIGIFVFDQTSLANPQQEALAPPSRLEDAAGAAAKAYGLPKRGSGNPAELLMVWISKKQRWAQPLTIEEIRKLWGFSPTTIRKNLFYLLSLGVVEIDVSKRSHTFKLAKRLENASPEVIGNIISIEDLHHPTIHEENIPEIRKTIDGLLGPGEREKTEIRKITTIQYCVNDYIVHDGYDWTKLLRANKQSPTVFHGTSSVLLESILAHGLDRNHYCLSAEDIHQFDQLNAKYAPLVFRDVRGTSVIPRKEQDFSLTLRLKTAIRYATEGPEVILMMLEILERMLNSSRDIVISKKDRQTMMRLKEKYNKIMEKHKPVVLVIQTPLDPGDEIVGVFSELMNNQVVLDNAISIAKGESQNSEDRSVNMCVLTRKKANPDFSAAKIIESIVRENNYAVHKIRVPPKDIIGVIEVPEEQWLIQPMQIHFDSLVGASL